jgi:catechol 2,3-dioxygenase-like lactoylglutathione lyase family enzyme
VPNIKGIAHFGIAVDDLERSERFYCDVLGGRIKTRHQGPNPHIGVIIGNQGLDIFLRPTPGGEKWAYGVPGGLHFAFEVSPEDIDDVLAHVRSHGVSVNEPVMHGGSRVEPSRSLSFYFEDPDGYALEFSVIHPTAEAARADWERRGSHTRHELKGIWGERPDRVAARA